MSIQHSANSAAPSWSWASVDADTAHMSNASLFGNLVKVIDVQGLPCESSFSTDSVPNDYLKLHGYLLRIQPGPFSANSFFPDCKDDITEGHHFCLPLRLQMSAQGDFLCGLVLRNVDDAIGFTFERVGMFRFREGNSLHVLGHGDFGIAYIFTEDPGDILGSMSLNEDILII
ncbi:hypothetical protein CC86DRAFT_388282 [Ophiobolus disseminans]|uniref:Uncharacterized protein n=1 Tax=Ophiobolus disseminans TaxID=1469910 RepID=A0A6A6ZEK3_9PLEO|nr:hypothetical protein CC86DRAFT_388282 [Ophiobolus disseminans]